MRNRMRYSQFSEVPGAMADVRRWGYPRDLEDVDWHSAWVCVGDRDAWLWFQWIGEKTLAVHMSVAPDMRGRVLNRRILEGGLWFVEFMGAERVVAVDIEPGSPMGRRLKRWDWVETEDGLSKGV